MDKNNSNLLTNINSYHPVAGFEISRRLGFDKKIIVNNISGKDAMVLLSPKPISSISPFELEKLGNLAFSHIGGEIKCQQFGTKNNNAKEYDLDSRQIYYTVFFDFDGKWKCPYKDRKINSIPYSY